MTQPTEPITAGEDRIVPRMQERLDSGTFVIFYSTALTISYHHNLRRSHALGCSPCPHGDVFDDNVWNLWDQGMDVFCLRLLFEINKIVGIEPAEVDTQNGKPMDEILYLSYFASRTYHPHPSWLRYGILPLDEDDAPTQLGLHEVDKKLYELGRNRPDMPPIPKFPNTDMLRSVVYAFGLLGWIGNGQGCDTRTMFKNEQGPTQEKGRETLESVFLMPGSFFERIFKELEAEMPEISPEKTLATDTLVIRSSN